MESERQFSLWLSCGNVPPSSPAEGVVAKVHYGDGAQMDAVENRHMAGDYGDVHVLRTHIFLAFPFSQLPLYPLMSIAKWRLRN